jgi:transposase-like protein
MENRGRFNSKEKVQILLESFSKEITVTDICKKYSIHPNLYYQCKKELFENAESIFVDKRSKVGEKKEQEKIKKLEAKLTYKDQLISEIVEENMRYKKKLNGEI